MPFEAEAVASARRHLRKKDPVMRRLIDVVGPFTLKARRDRFRAEHPVVELTLSTQYDEESRIDLRAGDIDAAFFWMPLGDFDVATITFFPSIDNNLFGRPVSVLIS